MEKKIINYVISILILFVAVKSNPSEERHKKMLISAVNISEEHSENGFWNSIVENVGTWGFRKYITYYMKDHGTYDNYFFFSTYKITKKGEQKLASIGAFGYVLLLI